MGEKWVNLAKDNNHFSLSFGSEGTFPLSDWHETTNGLAVGHQASTVVGAYFIKLLEAAFQQEK